MNEKEISELRRRFRADRNYIPYVKGAYIGDHNEIISTFQEDLGMLPVDEVEKIYKLLKKSLSGTLGRNLVELSFETRAVVDGAEHGLLMKLRNSALQDDDLLRAFYEKVAKGLTLEYRYLILLAYDSYDVPYKSKNDETFADQGTDVFQYFVCVICPVKETKPSLGYSTEKGEFRNIGTDWVISQPELGFAFPAFDDRAANIYGAMYYTRNPADNHPDFVETVFKTPLLMPAAEQKETFQNILTESLEDSCSYQVMQAVQDQLSGLIAEHKEQKIPEPLTITQTTVQGILDSCNVPAARQEEFAKRYEESFGADTALSPRNLVDPKHMQLETPQVTVSVNPERSDLVETRIINGVKYILVRADEGVIVNGVTISINE